MIAMLKRYLAIILCVLAATACSGLNPHGMKTDTTVPIYNKKF